MHGSVEGGFSGESAMVIKVINPLAATQAPGSNGLPVVAINQVAISGVVPPK